MNVGSSTPVSQLPMPSSASDGQRMAMQPGFASNEQYAVGKNRQDAVGQSIMPQNTHMHPEYAPDTDETVRDALEQMNRPLPPDADIDMQAQHDPRFLQEEEEEEDMFASGALVAPSPAALDTASAPVRAPVTSRTAGGWFLSSREISILVLTILLCFMCGILPLDRYLSVYAPCLAGSPVNAALIVLVARAVIVGSSLIFMSRMFGLMT